MNAYAMYDRAEDERDARHVQQLLIEEEEANLADCLDKSLTLRLLQEVVTAALASKLEHPVAIQMAFDNDFKFQDSASEFWRLTAETLAHYDVKIKYEEAR